MKSMLKLPLVAVAFALAVPFSFAQEKDAPPPPPPGEHGPKDGPGRGGPRGDRFKMLVEKLGLTEDQQAKIKPILAEEMQAIKTVRDDASLEREAKWTKIREIIQAHNEKIKPILTPEQLKKLEEMKDDFRGRGPGGPGGPRKEKGDKPKE
ncbi:MAG: hypothetical protein QM715_11490 [Nibricoccus sp.]